MQTFYDESSHTYYVDGQERPSVTEICEPISFKRLNALDYNILQKAKNRGSRCHELFEEYALSGQLDINEIETEYIPYIQQYILWFRTECPNVLYTEKQLFGEDFCGTCDLICEIDGKTCLVDYKCTANADKKSLSVQLEGYYRLCKAYGIKIDCCYYLHVKKDSYVFKEITRNPEWFDILLKHNKFMKEKYNERK